VISRPRTGKMAARMIAFLVRRGLFGVLVVGLTAFFAYGMIRLLRPEEYGGGQPLLTGTWQDVDRQLLHLELGGPDIKELWLQGVWADLFLLAGGVVVAVAVGVAGGLWCAARPRSRASRAVEAVAMFFLCAPVYAVALAVLLLFAPPFGLVELPYFFDPNSYAPPLEDPWDFLRSMLVPWVVVAMPLAAAILRLTLALTIDAMGEEWVRTARAKGLSNDKVVRRHAAPPTYATVAALFGASAPIMVTNMVLVEWVFSIPGFFRHMRRALGQNYGAPEQIIDVPMIQTLSMWAAVLIVALGLIGDLAIVKLDPRIRSAGRMVG
jgi:peptide/nickel transport system permease protein